MNSVGEYFEVAAQGCESPVYRACVEEIAKTVTSLMFVHRRDISAIQSEDGEVAISFGGSIKGQHDGRRLNGKIKLTFSKKFSDEGEFITPDFDQPELFKEGQTVPTPKAGSMAVALRGSGPVIDADEVKPDEAREQKLLGAGEVEAEETNLEGVTK